MTSIRWDKMLEIQVTSKRTCDLSVSIAFPRCTYTVIKTQHISQDEEINLSLPVDVDNGKVMFVKLSYFVETMKILPSEVYAVTNDNSIAKLYVPEIPTVDEIASLVSFMETA